MMSEPAELGLAPWDLKVLIEMGFWRHHISSDSYPAFSPHALGLIHILSLTLFYSFWIFHSPNITKNMHNY